MSIYNILSEMYNYDFYWKTLNEYIEDKNKNWDLIDSHYDDLRNYILEKLKLSLSKNNL